MQIQSAAFENGGKIPITYSCDGQNINPPLEFVDIPENTQNLVLIMEDPDVPKDIKEDGMFDHWVVFNIPPEITSIDEDSNPVGVVGANSNGENKYTGPCPPDKKHRYFFKLFALDSLIDLSEGATKKDVEDAMQEKIIEKAELVGEYERS